MTKGFSILIADDNEINRWLLREQLEHWTDDVAEAANGQEAWQFLQSSAYSLVFLDINMPFLNGFELIEKLRNCEGPNQTAPVIAVTADRQSLQRQQVIAAGFDEHLVKPLRLQHLQQVMAVWRNGYDEAVDYYAEQLLKKTQNNQQLTEQLLNKLFMELPGHLFDIDQQLQENQLKQAWSIVHKLQGTFCFFDFADFLILVESLEKALLNEDVALAYQRFNALKAKFEWLQDNKVAVLERAAVGIF
jgi:CheY-like chemotaxis protein